MSEDWGIETTRAVTPAAVMRGLRMAVPWMSAGVTAADRPAEVRDGGGVTRAWVSAPSTVGGVTRVEVCVPRGRVPGFRSHVAMATHVAEALAASLGGRATRLTRGGADPATGAPSTPWAGSPCDLVTERAAVLLQSRSEVPLNAWTRASSAWAWESGRQWTLLTPEGSTPTDELVEHITDSRGLWVVERDGGFTDGPSGRAVVWADGCFHPTDTPVPGRASDDGQHA